jgi:hypothetical protein
MGCILFYLTIPRFFVCLYQYHYLLNILKFIKTLQFIPFNFFNSGLHFFQRSDILQNNRSLVHDGQGSFLSKKENIIISIESTMIKYINTCVNLCIILKYDLKRFKSFYPCQTREITK